MPPKEIMLKRILISLLLGLLVGVVVSEIPFLLLQETARLPKDVLITIPIGTAELVARGEQPPSIPANMVFVVGDVLIVKNEDVVDHKLGPLWIPANSSAQLSLDEEENLAFECSFQPGNYFGLDVHQPLTWSTRLFGVSYVGIPMAILFALYSFVIPFKKKENVPA